MTFELRQWKKPYEVMQLVHNDVPLSDYLLCS